jgi:class 3 adenylate cyclase/tetratricopeptide (TPR) repeat protein
MITDTRPCWNCGQPNSPTARFCANCGKPQQELCPECGTPVAEGARFCANCGIPLAAHAHPPAAGPVLTAEARKVVTVLFVDLADSTPLTEQLDPEDARMVVGQFYTVVQHAVERFGGTVANLIGDEVLSVFGLPVTHEDDPERAVRAGLAVRDALPVLNEHLAATVGVRLAVRVGINTGEVVAASGSTFDRDFLVADAVTSGARIMQNVPAGSVVVGERTYRATKEAIDYRPLPPLTVKGKSAPLMVWTALAPLPESPEDHRIAAPLVGRHGELGLLRHLYQRSREDRLVQMVTVFGQAGVGKSRLLREFLAEVRDDDPPPLVLRGRGVAFGGQIGYHALLEILRIQAGLMDTDRPEIVRSKMREWLTAALGEGGEALLEGLLLTFGAADGGPEAAADPEQLRRALFDAWQGVLVGLAAARPVILALEDLHLADDGVLDLISAMVERIAEAPVFVMCLTRPELLERRRNWGGGGRNAISFELKPLRPEEAEALVAALSSKGLAAEMRQAVAQRAEGNPLFVEELVRMLMEGGGPGGAIPDNVQAVLTARIDRLPPDERRALQAASVLGRAFWPSAVRALAGLEENAVQPAIDALISKELVVARPRSAIGEPEYAFRHILTRDVAYGLLPKTQRQRAHAEALRWLEGTLGERTEDVIDILGEHARAAGDDARAAGYLHRAANKARRLYANEDALRLFDQALEAASRAGLPPGELATLARDRGEVHQLRGSYPDALTDFSQALTLARAAGDRRLEAQMEQRVGFIHHRELRLDEAEEHFSRAAILARETEDRRTLGLSLLDLANVGWDRGEIVLHDPRLPEGIAFLRQAGDLSGVARGLNLMAMGHFAAANGEEALAAVQEALAAARRAGDKSKEATSISYLSVIHAYWGRYPEALRYGEEAFALAESIGDRRRMGFTVSFIAPVLLGLGRWGEALRRLEEMVRELRETAKIHLPFALMYLAQVIYEIGDVGRTRALLAEALALDAPANPGWQQIWLLSSVLAARLDGDQAEVNRAIDRILALPWNIFIPDDGEVIGPVGEALYEAGRIDDLRAFVRDRRPGVERWGAAHHLASLALLEALLAYHDGRPGEAEVRLKAGIAQAESIQNVTLQLGGYERLWEWFHRPDDRETLRGLLRRVFDSLPEDLRAIALASPRGAILRKEDDLPPIEEEEPAPLRGS